MINSGTLERVKKAQASKTHVERKGPDTDGYGATVATGGSVNVPPVAVRGWDGTVTTERLNYLARLCGRGGFVVSARTGHEARVRDGYAVGIFRHRDQLIGGFVKGRDILAYIVDNWDLLKDPRVLLSARRGPNGTTLNVCAVVEDRQRARNVAKGLGRQTFVDMRDGRIVQA